MKPEKKLEFSTVNLTSVEPRSGKELHNATIPYTKEIVAISWFATFSTLIILSLSLLVAMNNTWWPLRLAASIFGGMCMVRGFVIFHDYMPVSYTHLTLPTNREV